MKKVLIITYYWPPSGGSGVQRWLKFAKYLPEFGWQPIVYTPRDSEFALKYGDDDSVANVPVLGTTIFDPGSLFSKSGGGFKVGEINRKSAGILSRLAIWFRANVFVPDSKVFWVRKSVNYISAYLDQNHVDLIVTTGPPHSMHLIGLGVKARTGVKWVADFRDPWSDGDILDQLGSGKKAMESHRQLEKGVLEKADLVVSVTESMAESLAAKGHGINTTVITNGYDEADFDVSVQKDDKFNLTYSGLLYGKRNPSNLWIVLDELMQANEQFSKDLVINIAGVVEESVDEQLSQLNCLSGVVNRLGYLSHQDSINECLSAAVLILTVDSTKNGRMLIPGKLFEYLACQVPILGFGNPGCDSDRILVNSGHDHLIPYEDSESIKARVSDLYEQWQLSGTTERSHNVNQFSRRNLTGALSKEFNNLLES